jgi:hypothetical protein
MHIKSHIELEGNDEKKDWFYTINMPICVCKLKDKFLKDKSLQVKKY